MTRARHPDPNDIVSVLIRRLGMTGNNFENLRENVHSVRIGNRVYDRKTGNFKAVGWQVTVKIFRRIPEPLGLLRTVVWDDELERFYQQTL